MKVIQMSFSSISDMFTLPKTNIAPENKPSQKENHLPTIHFQVRTVSFREGISVSYIFLNIKNTAVFSVFSVGP